MGLTIQVCTLGTIHLLEEIRFAPGDMFGRFMWYLADSQVIELIDIEPHYHWCFQNYPLLLCLLFRVSDQDLWLEGACLLGWRLNIVKWCKIDFFTKSCIHKYIGWYSHKMFQFPRSLRPPVSQHLTCSKLKAQGFQVGVFFSKHSHSKYTQIWIAYQFLVVYQSGYQKAGVQNSHKLSTLMLNMISYYWQS